MLAFFRVGDELTPRVGMALGGGKLIDVARALERKDPTVDLANFQSVRTCIEGGERILEDLRELAAWSAGRAEEIAGALVEEAEIEFLPPIPDPEKFLCVGKNSRFHREELARTGLIKEMPQEPTGFIKLNSVLVGHGAEVARPDGIEEFDYEPEMAFVISKPGYRVRPERALDHVFGITAFNDLTAREIQRREVQSGTKFWTAKNMPGFGPIGPYVATLDEIERPDDLWVTCHVNGQLKSRFNTSDLIYGIPEILEHFTRYMPMKAADIFATGSAGGIGAAQEHPEFLKPGDVVDAGIEGLMSLRSRIVAPN